ncbi:MFS transporter [Streptomyces profundus]|uniref:MFS transporter n=1 Tax=Streptomyces profundus TaxID=2867410 RepID=UPI001D161EE8|nr:MFS transporter [Streptomyces sp. MA3_2.13]UED85566.1 MFS transporter [Streptomyces sp. MA3_2.13]
MRRGGRRARRAGLGRPFNTLWAATAVSNVGDGIVKAAAPLLVASVTASPALIGWAVFVQQLPWLLFSLVSGVYVDRLDRRRLIVVINLLRGAVIGGLALAVWGDAVNVPVIYVAGFLLGTCETLGDNASAAMIPATVRSEDLPRANARMQVVFYVIDQFSAPPLGAALFVVAAALPFGVNAVTFALAALLISTLRDNGEAPAREPARERRRVRGEIAEGVRWLWNQPTIRMISVTLALMNITLLAGFSVLVLYARERLGLGEIGYGLLLSASAAGGLLGALCAVRLTERFRTSALLRAALVLESLTHLGLALAQTVWLVISVLLLFGAHNAVFGVVVRTLRQRMVPDALRGRVESVFMMFSMGGAALGALIGGPIAVALGVTGPFWIAFAVMAALTLVAWRPFGRSLPEGARGGPRASGSAGKTGPADGSSPDGDEPPASELARDLG